MLTNLTVGTYRNVYAAVIVSMILLRYFVEPGVLFVTVFKKMTPDSA